MTEYSFPDYITQLKERRPEIAEFVLRCERDHLTTQDYTAMRNCIRSLTALTQHQSDLQIHKLALSMQEALNPETLAARINLISLGRTLLAACHNVLLNTTEITQSFLPDTPFAEREHRPTLLSVDDDRIIHGMMEAMFGAHVTILTASNGKEGLEMIRHHKPDLVLLDDAMPEMSGMTLIETLQGDAELALTTVIMLTSSDRPQDIERAMNAGAVDYIVKPFDPKILAEKVYKQLQTL